MSSTVETESIGRAEPSPADSRLAADPSAEPSVAEAVAFFTWPRIAKIGILALLFAAIFHVSFRKLFNLWWNDDNWSHGLVIPFFCVGILLAIRQRWLAAPLKPTYWGLVVVGAGLLGAIFSILVLQNDMPENYSGWLLLVGLVVGLCGWRFARTVWFPMFFLLFGIPVAGRIYNPVSTRLQEISAVVSYALLRATGIQADLAGVTITLFRDGKQVGVPLQVAEACSGMHTLMALLALGALVAYMIQRPWWHRLAIVLAIVPIAILSNSVRVLTLGLFNYAERGDLVDESTSPTAHSMVGLLVFAVALALFMGLHTLLSRLWVEEESEAPPAPASPRAGPPSDSPAGRFRRPIGSWADIVAGLGERHFLTTAAVLLVAALSWTTVVGALGLALTKSPVPLRQALDRFPRRIARPDGTFWVVREGFTEQYERLPEAVEKRLGAVCPWRLRGNKSASEAPDSPGLLHQSQYLQRAYVLVDADGREVDSDKRVVFFVGYYTGTVNIVAHIPERCYLGAGYNEGAGGDRDFKLDSGLSVPLRVVQFRRDLRGEVRNVAYLFSYNGDWSANHAIVRWELSSPFSSKKAYMAKIEMNFETRDLNETRTHAEFLLKDFLPILQKDFLPDWDAETAPVAAETP